jgi:hypothetical protein
MIKRNITLASVATLCLGLGACSSQNVHLSPNPPITGSSAPAATQYVQIERLSRPAVKEVFEPFQDHQISNAVEPYADTTIQNDIKGTEDFVRPATSTTDYGALLSSVLYPDEYLVNLAGTAPTSSNNDPEFFLSTEVDGASYFGGRSPSDDVVGLELPVLFGHTLSKLGLIAEDNEENDCLSAENISQAPSQAPSTTFPYLASPH